MFVCGDWCSMFLCMLKKHQSYNSWRLANKLIFLYSHVTLMCFTTTSRLICFQCNHHLRHGNEIVVLPSCKFFETCSPSESHILDLNYYGHMFDFHIPLNKKHVLTHSQLLAGLKCESKWKTAEEGRVRMRSQAHNTLRGRGACWRSGMGLGRIDKLIHSHGPAHNPHKVVSA